MFEKVDIHSLSFNPFDKVGKDWLLISATKNVVTDGGFHSRQSFVKENAVQATAVRHSDVGSPLLFAKCQRTACYQ